MFIKNKFLLIIRIRLHDLDKKKPETMCKVLMSCTFKFW